MSRGSLGRFAQPNPHPALSRRFSRRRRKTLLRIPEAAHGRRPVRGGDPARAPRRALPRVYALVGFARGPAAAYTGAPAAWRTAQNSSFVNRITDEGCRWRELVRDPVETVSAFASIPHPHSPAAGADTATRAPNEINSMGINLASDDQLRTLAEQVNAATTGDWRDPARAGRAADSRASRRHQSADRRRVVGQWQPADAATVEGAAERGRRATGTGTARRWPRARPSSSTRPTCWKRACRSSSRCARARPARPFPTASPGCAGGGFPALLRKRSAPPVRGRTLARPTGRIELAASCPAAACSSVHLAVELPAGDLRRPGRCRARRRQQR